MSIQLDTNHTEIVDQLGRYLKGRMPEKQAALIKNFAKRFYISTSDSDLAERSNEDIFGALLSQWNLLYQRAPGESKVYIFNPTFEKDGWVSPHTIIEISHDDIPFLVDSVRMELNRSDIQVHFMIHIGGLKLLRDKENHVTDILPLGEVNPKATSEAPIYIEIDRIVDEVAMQNLAANIEKILGDVRAAVNDWSKMVARAEEALLELEREPPPLDLAEISESKDFLRWLINNNFTFLGSRDYRLIGNEKTRALQVVPGTGLGVLRDDSTVQISKSYSELPPQARKLALSKNILIIAKTNTRSTVHRDTYTDYIGIKRFDDKGEVIGERRFIGLYTSTAYHMSPHYIPFLRHKVTKVLQEFHYPPDSHNGKEVVHILETLPRDDLLQATHEELVDLTMGILQLQERKQIRLFVRRDSYGRYFSCLVYMPRENFTTDLSLALQEQLMQAFQGIESSYATYFSDSVLARVHFIIRVNPKTPIEFNLQELEKILIETARSWTDELKLNLIHQFGEGVGLKYYSKYHKAFPAGYMEYYPAHFAIFDIERIEKLTDENPLEMRFYRSVGKDPKTLRLKLFHKEHTIALSDILPTLENMGLRIIGERPYELIFKDGTTVWINDFDMSYAKDNELNIDDVKDLFMEAFAKVWFKQAEDDGFNRLVFEAKLSWHEIAMLRAYAKYLRQIGFTFSQSYIEKALTNHADIVKDFVELIKLRFSPAYPANQRPNTDNVITKIEAALEEVSSLDEDRILRRMLEVILATIRTNYFQTTADGQRKSYISLKFDPGAISDLPLPRPVYEIFVYSPQVEGVHLRGGKVARGGIRWSDRREDFRTEILGLMKAQQVKNSVIVPVGAKGGFYPKNLPLDADRSTIMKEAIKCYSIFIRGLLDLTDNIVNDTVVPAVDVVRYDEEDTYLVVAADKGTATFSDIANNISLEYGFWLGDAFASGGSSGYDHKKMGITARGAWESVKRHFRELGMNPETDDFTVVGIGDMAGDVFGNGMLLSKHIKLLAAFNHVHIFLDPDPNPEASFEERRRLFNLPGSTWMDYSDKLISKGGGVFSRSLKSIKISPEVKNALKISADHLTPTELISAILRSPVDLIWNGGIGTYVKASYETDADVGDRANDSVRINADELTARVVAEGGNLGFTQLARIEYSLGGGIIYTDFIDNSAGVDCSDHEVNIKILLNKLVAAKRMTLDVRNKLLETMTDEVASLVLRDNYEQTQMLSLEASVNQQTMELLKRYMLEAEKEGRLNRKLEFLPSEKTLAERKANDQSLTRPEIAILLAYCKLFLKQDILASDLPENSYYEDQLMSAFPKLLSEKYFADMKQHSLRREIIATQLAKNITDHMGINFVERLQRETGASVSFIVRSFSVAENIYRLNNIWHQIEELDWKVTPDVQRKMMLELFNLIRRSTRWFLRNRKADLDIQETAAYFASSIAELKNILPEVITTTEQEVLTKEIANYIAAKVPEPLAKTMAIYNMLFTSLEIVEGAVKYQLPLREVAITYYLIGERFDLNWLRQQMNGYMVENQWDELARSAFRDDLDRAQRKLVVSILTQQEEDIAHKKLQDRIDIWLGEHKFLMGRWQKLMTELKANSTVGFVTYSVILRELLDFAQAG